MSDYRECESRWDCDAKAEECSRLEELAGRMRMKYEFLRDAIPGYVYERMWGRWPMSDEEADAIIEKAMAKE